ncbi:MAG: hypothetical protein WCR52_13195 [Bacteroidota bacterium]
MKAGIIAEGKSDMAVITNILKGKLGIDKSDIAYLVPELEKDETDLAIMRPEQFSSWSIVKAKCEAGNVVRDFMDIIDDGRFLVIHIDSAERNDYGVENLTKNTIDDLILIRNTVKSKIEEWLGENRRERIAYAIAVEETDAWVMTKYAQNRDDTGMLNNPKERLASKIIQTESPKAQKQLRNLDFFDRYGHYSYEFRKNRNLSVFIENNNSLKQFCDELETLRS